MATKPKATKADDQQPQPGAGSENAGQQPQPGAGEEITGQQPQAGAGEEITGSQPQPGAGGENTEQQPQPGAGGENTGQKPPTPKQEVPPRTKGDRISESLQAVGRDALARNPQFKAVYVTANGYVFPNESDAINHAKSLKNKRIETVNREG